MDVGVPVYCPHCGTLFASRAFRLQGNVRGLKLSGNHESCPVCGKMADLIDGTFDATDGVLEMASRPSFSSDILERFTGLVERALKREISTEELEKQATVLDPNCGAVVSKLRSLGPVGGVALILLILALKACQFHVNVDAKVDLNQLWSQWAGQSQIVYSPSSSGSQPKNPKRETSGGREKPSPTAR